MPKREVVILKNGQDVLRIIEGKKSGDNCEFKIVPLFSSRDIRFFTMSLDSIANFFPFDQTKQLEITYHMAQGDKPTKIHLKLEDPLNKDNVKYDTLPLVNLLDPKMDTEIPIPLFKLILPENISLKPFEPSKGVKYIRFDIGSNNVIELFMTKNGFHISEFIEKWPNISCMLFNNCMQFLATGNSMFVGYNIDTILHQCKIGDGKYNMMVHTNITPHTGMLLNTIKDPRVETKNADFLFIENAYYLNMIAMTTMVKDGVKKLAYEFDLENEK